MLNVCERLNKESVKNTPNVLNIKSNNVHFGNLINHIILLPKTQSIFHHLGDFNKAAVTVSTVNIVTPTKPSVSGLSSILESSNVDPAAAAAAN